MTLADVLGKMIDIGVLLGSCIVKFPQVLKIGRARSVVGISEASIVVEGIGYVSTCWYSAMLGYPFGSWGEAAIVSVQCFMMLLMFWFFSEDGLNLRIRFCALFVVALCCVALQLVELSPAVVAAIGLVPSLLFLIARVPQILLNHQQGHTGQLAAATFFLQLAGCLARIFTVMHSMGGDVICLAQHVSSGVLNLILLLQIAKFKKATHAVVSGGLKKQESL
mmetsp:Transcript_10806/g.27942  ORF Transcript_10806/g.27942 Transcript_10806/m.27942 type:complete len:222 (-) Transcript_10806:67-732(-)